MSEPQQHHAPPHAPAIGAPASGLGMAAFVTALAALLLGLLVTVTFPFVVRISDYSSVGLVSGLGNGLMLVIAIAALVLGLVAVRRSRQQVLAGIAIGIASATIVGVLVGWLSSLLFAFAY